jgi:hypothetical protein
MAVVSSEGMGETGNTDRDKDQSFVQIKKKNPKNQETFYCKISNKMI